MSKYAFSVKNSAALLAKAKHDAERFNRPNNNAIAWSYAAIDFIQTAWHIGDWISKESGQPLSQVRQDIDELCNGSFFRVYAEVCGLILAFLGSGGRNAATIFSLRNSSSR